MGAAAPVATGVDGGRTRVAAVGSPLDAAALPRHQGDQSE